MNQLNWFFGVWIGMFILSCTDNNNPNKEMIRPNLIVIMTDDQEWADVGFNGCQDIPTPTTDRVRSIRKDRFRYVRNYKTDRIFLQTQYKDRKYYTKNIHAPI
ncbi:MAG: hypothetical protein AAF587_33690 [Bacteroidota bacterium]